MVERVKSEHGRGVGLVLPPGFRFHPTDEEVITSYLLHKFLNPSFAPHAIGEVDLNKCEPWDLPSKAKMGENSKEWYFFCHKDMKYPTGTRANRATKEGYWKATGKDREIFKPAGRDRDRELVGMRKTLVFYMGRAPRGTKTNWVMHEFRLEGKSRHTCNLRFNPKDEWVVSKVHHKGGKEASAAKKAAGGGEEHYSSAATPNVSSVEASEGDDVFLVDSLLDYSSYFNCSAPGGLPLPSTTTNSAAAAATNNDDSSSWTWSMLPHAPADQQAMVGSYSLHHQAMAAKAVGGGGGVTSPSFSTGLPSSPVADYVGNDASGYHTNNY